MPPVSQRTIRVAVVGGHPMILGVVRLACREASDLELVREMDNSDVVSAAVSEMDPDVVIVDLDMPDGDGLSILRGLQGERFTGRVLVLTDRAQGALVLEALRLGADGYLTKAHGLGGIAAAVRRVFDGDRLIDPRLEDAALQQLGRFATQARERSEAEAALTPREREVLVLLADGHTLQQIARRLGISPRTVETHVANLYRRLDVRTRVQAVTRAAKLGLIDLG